MKSVYDDDQTDSSSTTVALKWTQPEPTGGAVHKTWKSLLSLVSFVGDGSIAAGGDGGVWWEAIVWIKLMITITFCQLNNVCIVYWRWWWYRVTFFTVTPNFSTKNKTGMQPITCTCLTVFFLVLKLGGTCEKNHPVYLMVMVMVMMMAPEHVPFPPGLFLSQCWCNDH